MNYIDIIRLIQSTTSSNEKIRILTEHKDNQDLAELLHFVYNPKIITGISDKKIIMRVDNDVVRAKNNFHDVFDYLKCYNTGRLLDIMFVQSFIDQQPEDDQGFWRAVLSKSLNIGMTAKSLNKVYGDDFIPSWEVQQAYPVEKYSLKKNEWFALSLKLNGNRFSYYKGQLISRQGHILEGVSYIINEIKKLNLDHLFLDGELIRDNVDNLSDNENFRIGTGIVNSDLENKTGLVFHIFDVFPMSEFDQGESKKTYRNRLENINQLSGVLGDSKYLKIVHHYYEGCDQSQVKHYLDMVDENGFEGLMLNRDTTYKCKRHNGILKVKSFKHCDVKCLDVVEGTGKYVNTLGSIIVNYKGYTVNVGSGFTDEQRDFYWSNPTEIIGKIVQVKYKEESKNKKDNSLSMQFPVFECIRTDKTVESYN